MVTKASEQAGLKPALKLTVQFPDPRLKKQLPTAWLKKTVHAALFAPAELTLRFVGTEEGRTLNRDFRGKDNATNVLTFAYSEDSQGPTVADIVFCSDILLQEASDQHKTLPDHAAHLIVHGVLHAQGYDHNNDDDAEEMEALEIEILATLGIANPYSLFPEA